MFILLWSLYRYGHSNLVTYLINQDGINVFAKDRDKLTPLAVAKRYVYKENKVIVIKLFVANIQIT